MKSVPIFGAAVLLCSWTNLGHGQDPAPPIQASDIQPHQAASTQLAACLIEADARINVLAEQLRQLKTQRQRLATLEDALSKVTQQKSTLEAQLQTLGNEESDSHRRLTNQLLSAERTESAYRQETERLRRAFTQHTDLIRTLEDALSKVTRQKSSLQANLISESHAHETALTKLQNEHIAATTLAASTTQELEALREKLAQAEAEAAMLEPLKLASEEKQAALTQEIERLRLTSASTDKERADLQRQLQEAQLAASSADAARNNAMQASAALTQELETLRTRFAQVQTEQQDLGNTRTALQEQLAEAQRQASAALQAQQETAARLAESEKQRLASVNSLTVSQNEWKLFEKAIQDQIAEQQTKHTELALERDRLAQALNEAQNKLAANSTTQDDQSAALAQSQEAVAIANEKLRMAERALEQTSAEQQTKDIALSQALSEIATWKTQHEAAEKALQAERRKAEDLGTQSKSAADALQRAQTLEQELLAARAQAKRDSEALAKLTADSQASTAKLSTLSLAQTQASSKAQDAEKALTTLQQQLAARDNELNQLKNSLGSKEETWTQTRITFQTKQQQLEAQLAAATKATAIMQQDFIQIDPIRYELNSAAIDDEQARVRDQAKKILSIYPKASFEISGHTCTLGDEERNRELSEQRAKRLLDFLVANGVPVEQLTAAGFGETQPIADNGTDAGRRQNRRVEIRVKSADGTTLLDTEDRNR